MILNDEDRENDSKTRKDGAYSMQRNKFRSGKQRGVQNENIKRKAFVASITIVTRKGKYRKSMSTEEDETVSKQW